MTERLIREYPKKKRYEIAVGGSPFAYGNRYYWRKYLWSAILTALLFRFFEEEHVTITDTSAADSGQVAQ